MAGIALRQCQLRAAGAEQAQAQRVGPLHRPLGQVEVARAQHEHRADAQRQQRPQPGGMFDPEEGPAVEQHIAQRAAAKGGEPGDHAHTDPVEPLASRLEQARQRKGERRCGFNRGQQQRIQRRLGHGGDRSTAPPPPEARRQSTRATTASTNTSVPSARLSARRWRMAFN